MKSQKSVSILRSGDNLQNGATLKQRRYVPKCWIKSFILIFFVQKVLSLLHNVMIEPLMADFWRCFSFFSGLLQCNLLGSQWDSNKPPGSHPSENDKIIIFGVEYPTP